MNDAEERKPGWDECQRNFYGTFFNVSDKGMRLSATGLSDRVRMLWVQAAESYLANHLTWELSIQNVDDNPEMAMYINYLSLLSVSLRR